MPKVSNYTLLSLLFVCLFLGACRQAWQGKGKYKVSVKVIGEKARWDVILVSVWDKKWNVKRKYFWPKAGEDTLSFTSESFDVGQGIIADAKASSVDSVPIKIEMTVTKNGRVIRKSIGEGVGKAAVDARTTKNTAG